MKCMHNRKITGKTLTPSHLWEFYCLSNDLLSALPRGSTLFCIDLFICASFSQNDNAKEQV